MVKSAYSLVLSPPINHSACLPHSLAPFILAPVLTSPLLLRLLDLYVLYIIFLYIVAQLLTANQVLTYWPRRTIDYGFHYLALGRPPSVFSLTSADEGTVSPFLVPGALCLTRADGLSHSCT